MGSHASPASQPLSRRSSRPIQSVIDDDSFTFLFVCTGNICRSPLAERLLTSKLTTLEVADRQTIRVESAGLQTINGVAMDETAASEGLRLGAQIAGAESRVLDRTISMGANVLLTMTREQQVDLVKRYPALLHRTFTVREFARILEEVPEVVSAGESVARRGVVTVGRASAVRSSLAANASDDDIPDPYRRGDAVHRQVADMIEIAVSTISRRMFAI
ncbi:arsenate reductase/protein-tyrosine-phosphatase family protein [Subtercola endophyticus]|uniref:arsenate reductase/protein-tyrosine-phosphatase family protein n=1 Tax=Subtercola endophyticus TaxID=2895559 RepID=UPI001E3983C4|nr:hypothetical protein [Subtercola endophyticus]UFS57876.1 hypothetical protein LQ955_12615 [Subtercola endophyticus]